MDNPNVKVWYDSFSDILEVAWEHEDGYFTETDDDRVLERLDVEDNTTGFMIEQYDRVVDEQPGGAHQGVRSLLPSAMAY